MLSDNTVNALFVLKGPVLTKKIKKIVSLSFYNVLMDIEILPQFLCKN